MTLARMPPAEHCSPGSQLISTQRFHRLACLLSATLFVLCLRSNFGWHPSVPPALQLMSAAPPEFVMGIVSVPVAGGVAQSLARLLVSSQVRPATLMNTRRITAQHWQVAACVQILQGVTSIYEWEGKVVAPPQRCCVARHPLASRSCR
jgi:hypothetical protein